jgi:hypothetical protein
VIDCFSYIVEDRAKRRRPRRRRDQTTRQNLVSFYKDDVWVTKGPCNSHPRKEREMPVFEEGEQP